MKTVHANIREQVCFLSQGIQNIMSHEVNDNVKKDSEGHKAESDLNLISVHKQEGDKEADKTVDRNEEISKALEENEKAIVAAKEKIAEIARKVAALACCPEPHHFDAMKEWAKFGAAAQKPAYIEMQKHLQK